jgi:hypothetical protein
MIARCSGVVTCPKSWLTASIASAALSPPGRWIRAASLTSSMKRAVARFTSSATSSRISLSAAPALQDVSSTSSLTMRYVACSPSAGPNSSSSCTSSSAPSASRASTYTAAGLVRAPSLSSGRESTRQRRARVIAAYASRAERAMDWSGAEARPGTRTSGTQLSRGGRSARAPRWRSRR